MDKKTLDRMRELAGIAPVVEAPKDQSRNNMYQINESLRAVDEADGAGLDHNPAKGGYNHDDNSQYGKSPKALDYNPSKGGYGQDDDELEEDESGTAVQQAIAVLDQAIEAENDFDQGGGYGDYDDEFGDDEYDQGDDTPELVEYLEALKEYFLKGDVPTTEAHIGKITDAMYEALGGADTETADHICTAIAQAFGIEINVNEAAKPDFLDVDKDGDKKEPFKKATKDADEDLDEAAKPDFADIDDDGDKDETAKKAAKDAKDDDAMTEQQQMREWSNSIYQNYEDKGHVMDQPDGETVDNSLRRYLNAKPHKVQVSEGHTPKKLNKAYKSFKGKK